MADHDQVPGCTSGEEFDAGVAGIAALADPIRRALYRFVVASDRPVSRDRAAEGAGVAHHTAKFHLDRLVEEGLLDIEYSRPPGRGGPGAGRPAKLYRRSGREFAVSVPERHYELAGRLLAEAVVRAEQQRVPVAQALDGAARDTGRVLGTRARRRAGFRPGRAALRTAIVDALRDCGYDPRDDDDGVTLTNCPFHLLARDYTDLVCTMNLELLAGLLEGAEVTRLDAALDPAPGRCCVRMRTTR